MELGETGLAIARSKHDAFLREAARERLAAESRLANGSESARPGAGRRWAALVGRLRASSGQPGRSAAATVRG
jgi:hypothetical protein